MGGKLPSQENPRARDSADAAQKVGSSRLAQVLVGSHEGVGVSSAQRVDSHSGVHPLPKLRHNRLAILRNPRKRHDN